MQLDIADTGWLSHTTVAVQRYRGDDSTNETDVVIEETPVALVYNGVPHVVMLATPLDIEDFAIGFTLTEGIVNRIEDICSLHAYHRSDGIEVRLKIADHCESVLVGKERNLAGRTGCGLCGAQTLKQAVKPPKEVSRWRNGVERQIIASAMQLLSQRQRLNQLTGAIHAAGWIPIDADMDAVVREDVGRHNALDKLIGCLIRMKIPASKGFIVVTSRASYEMVQKSAAAGVGLLAAISAPTGMAIRHAQLSGMTLAGFVRGQDLVVYSHPERIF